MACRECGCCELEYEAQSPSGVTDPADSTDVSTSKSSDDPQSSVTHQDTSGLGDGVSSVRKHEDLTLGANKTIGSSGLGDNKTSRPSEPVRTSGPSGLGVKTAGPSGLGVKTARPSGLGVKSPETLGVKTSKTSGEVRASDNKETSHSHQKGVGKKKTTNKKPTAGGGGALNTALDTHTAIYEGLGGGGLSISAPIHPPGSHKGRGVTATAPTRVARGGGNSKHKNTSRTPTAKRQRTE